MANIIQDHLPSSNSMTVDLSEGYSFQTHIAATDLRPEIVWWNDDQKTLTLVELTVCFETSFEVAITRKEDRYLDLIAETRKAEYTSTKITVEMGSRGLQTCQGSKTFKLHVQEFHKLLLNASHASHPRIL